MDNESIDLENKIEMLTQMNETLLRDQKKYASAKQSFLRMSSRLKKLCNRLEPTQEIVHEMRMIAKEIKELSRQIAS